MLRLVFSLMSSAAIVAFSVVVSGTQGTLARYDLTGKPPLEVNANIRVHKVMGEIGTFMLGEFAPGFKSTPHHHTHDQINVGISGAYNVVTTAKPYSVSRLRGLVVPPNVEHGNLVAADVTAPLLIEFQPVRRTDFPPEREKVTFPMASSPTPPPAESLEFDFRAESPAWRRLPNGARVNARTGTAAAVSAWEIPTSLKTDVDVHSQLPAAELFVYILDGNIEARVGAQRHNAGPGVLLVSPPNSPTLQVHSSGSATAVLLIFEAVKAK
ncbi:MAG TPA: hypothetical protein VM115_11300 [Vicinamibacterales bacterium]|nr:hypothetical protein [Vicinamibacterales bacterium]